MKSGSSTILLGILMLAACAHGFVPIGARKRLARNGLHDTDVVVDETTASSKSIETPSLDPKDAVKLFGRLAEKYIMLDPTGGMCCYSACSDCEYRQPDGGYRMADQSASRPKWIPVYNERKFLASGKEHVSKWSQEIFSDGPAVTRDEFVTAVRGMTYNPPLGGPYLSASAATLDDEDEQMIEGLFDLLSNGNDKLTKFRMGKALEGLAKGSEGITWNLFAETVTSTSDDGK